MRLLSNFRYFIIAIAVLAATFAFFAPAQAQDETYVDLSVEVTRSSAWYFIARNHGTEDAYGVTVDIEIADQTIHSTVEGSFKQNSGTTCSGNIPGTTCISGIWTVGALEPGEEIGLTISPKLAPGLPCCMNAATPWAAPARAEIKNTVPGEAEFLKHDNTDVNWIRVNQLGGGTLPAEGVYWLESASVDDPLPEAGDTVNFSLAWRMDRFTLMRDTSLYGARLRLGLSPGMGTLRATAPEGTTFAADPDLPRTWNWDVGTPHLVDSIPVAEPISLEVSTTLDDPLPEGVTLSDLCLTAEITAERPDNVAQHATSAKVCLGEDPVTLFQTGETDLWDLFPCVGVTTYPCSSTDTVELVINGREAATAAGVINRSVSNEAILDPGKVVIHVNDPDGRSQVSGSTVWRTGSNEGDAAGIISGVVASARLPSPDFDQYSFSISDSTPGGKPGTVRIVNRANTSFVILDIDDQTSIGPVSTTSTAISMLFEFGELGTYEMDITASADHVGTDTQYSDTSTFTFHVGPMAELEVRDGDSNPAVPTGQRAFTIVAVNNGPDHAPAAQVTVTDWNTDHYVSHSATAGTFDHVTGVWTIGELRESGHQQAATGRDGEVLTIITGAAGDTEIEAAISNTQNYSVCIDSSGNDVDAASEAACTGTNTWHTTPYYDHIDDNDEATIRAKEGTGADLPVIQTSEAGSGAIEVTWSAITEVNGRRVTHYQVQKETNPWETVADNVAGTRYVDTGVEPGDTHNYRVRAFNDRGQPGPWSASSEGEVQIPVPGKPANLEATTPNTSEILLTWDAPAGMTPSRYELEVSNDGSTGWTSLDANITGNSHTHTGLQPGDTRHYRVRGFNSADPAAHGPWSDIAMATIPTDPVPGKPGALRATVRSASEIRLTWNTPAGVAVSRYELQVSVDGNAWTSLETSVMANSYTHEDLQPGDTRHYRVRAVDDRDREGPWSDTASATVPTDPVPGQPAGLEAASLSASELLVTWNTPAGVAPSHYELEVSDDGNAWMSLDASVMANSYTHGGLKTGDTRHYRVRGWNNATPPEAGPWSDPASATVTGPTVVTRTRTVTETVAEDPFAYFADEEITRTVAEGSAPGSPVGAPVTVVRNSGNRVAYSLEGPDAALFTIEQDSGQILVGQGAALDYESDTTSYTVVVVADPSSGATVRATVTISVTDVAETGTVAISPAGPPQVGVELTATLTHGGGQPSAPTWQWQRSQSTGPWLNIAGATGPTYTPTEQDAGRRLQVVVIYVEPGGGHGFAGAVTEALEGEEDAGGAPLSQLVAGYDADSNGSIDLNEVLAAIAAYFSEELDSDGALEVIGAYFAG